MRRFTRMLIIAVVVVGAFALPAAPRGLGPQVALASGAVVIRNSSCDLLDANGNGVVRDSSHTVITSNGNGLLMCKATNVPNSTGSAVRWNFENTGYACFTLAGITLQWEETISASGQAKLVCHIRDGGIGSAT